jgi:hypothetical protein
MNMQITNPADLRPAAPEDTASTALSTLHENALRVAEGMDRIAALLRADEGLAPLAARLGEEARQLRENRFTVMVVGEFKRGKSTLLNAMLGGVVLPQKNTPCTAIITVLRHAETPRVRVVFDPAEGRPDEVLDPKAFTAKYQLQAEDSAFDPGGDAEALDARQRSLAKEIRDRWGHIDRAEIEYPIALCREGVELVDSPGLEEDPARDRRVFEYLRQAHALIMVLDAFALLNSREIRFIQQTLKPLGLHRKVFFVINRWNLVLQSVIDPNDPEEIARAFGDQEKLIEARLKPLCVVDGRDLSAERIFRVNALGALQQRKASVPSPQALEETRVPALEASLTRYLASDRLRERQARDLATLDEVRAELGRFIQRRAALAGKSLEELERQARELQPKLDRLRDIRRHIQNYLAAKAATVAAELARQFDAYAGEAIEADLPRAVAGWPLGRLDGFLMTFDAALDLFRPEGRKFKDAVAAHLDAIIHDYFKAKVLAWTEGLQDGFLAKVGLEIRRELEAEVGHYVETMREIEEGFGVEIPPISVKDQLAEWLKGVGPIVRPDKPMIDLAPVIAAVAADVATHMALHFAPGIGLVISGILMLLRRSRVRNKTREQVLKGLLDGMEAFRHKQHAAIREGVGAGLRQVSDAITASIDNEIVLLDGNIRTLIERRQDAEGSAEQERHQLEELRARVGDEISRTRRHLELVAT